MSASGYLHAPHSPELALLARERGAYGFYRFRNVAINTWSMQPTGAAVEVLRQLTERSLSDCPDGIASIHWIESGAGLPTPEARQGLGEIAKRYSKHLHCVGVMLEGSGFWASALRSALSGIVLLSPRDYPLRFAADRAELVSFVSQELQRRTGEAPEPERLRRALEEVLRQLGEG
jgi:predicted nucleic acid-binding Zn ribbon protein